MIATTPDRGTLRSLSGASAMPDLEELGQLTVDAISRRDLDARTRYRSRLAVVSMAFPGVTPRQPRARSCARRSAAARAPSMSLPTVTWTIIPAAHTEVNAHRS